MKEEILDLQCRSMRDNLLFYNIKEAQNKEIEDCLRIIKISIHLNRKLWKTSASRERRGLAIEKVERFAQLL